MSVIAPFSPCIVIPCFNHGQMMAEVLASLAGYGLPCLVVDDGSAAVTADELQRLAAGLPWVQLLRLEQNQGKGAAVIAGLQLAHSQGYSHALQVDADGQHQLSDIPDMIAEARAHPDCLISGQPVYDSSVPKARLYGRYVTHVWVWIETLSLSLKDSMCGFRVYPVEPTLALAASHPLGKRMDFDTEVMVRLYWQGVPSRFLPTRVTYPADGVSHFDALRDNLRISWMHTRLFFGMLPRIPRLLRRKPANSLHWSATEERHGLWGIRLMLQVYRLFGRRAFQLLLYPVIGYFWLTGRAQRKASCDYLQRLREFAQGRQQALPAPLNSFRHFMRFGDAMLDKLSSWRGELHDIRLVDRAGCERQIASGKGTLILASHLGDIESCRALGELDSGVKINALVFTEHAERFNQVMKEVNPCANLNLIQVASLGPETAMRLQDKLNAGEWVAIVGDRTSAGKHQRGEQPRVVWSHFLGKPAPFPQGPFVLAAALRCPVFLMFGLKQQGRLNVYFEPFADPLLLPRAQRRQALQQAVDNYAARLEHYCLLAPLDWFNFFDFWQLAAQEPET
ncbi:MULTISPECIES: glycosyltransferase family 2 protein [unclassified Serratia (in: enterobacteria)]|uniref:glycosyltransferase family 2 protein n=1 Tax=unclassified Serratia (in: enterobacteria) TaxID=2647522 RepID=UPI002ECFC9AB|nr:glycosyltransferase [Serratia sp. C2(2)]MEE4448103.1 glycosyltransferase [Serratia sp. C2(1)]